MLQKNNNFVSRAKICKGGWTLKPSSRNKSISLGLQNVKRINLALKNWYL